MTPRAIKRAERLQRIVDGAQVRAELGEGALHEVLRTGEHQVIHNGRRVVGRTVAEVIAAARGGG